MTVLLVGAGLFLTSFVLQAVLWRVRLPRRQTPALLVLFSVVPIVAMAVALPTGFAARFSPPEIVAIALFYLSFSLAYISLYSALEMQSPTLAIVSRVAGCGSAGCEEADLFARFGQGAELSERLDVMERGRWIQLDGDVITLTPQGAFFARLFASAARIFGLARSVAKGG